MKFVLNHLEFFFEFLDIFGKLEISDIFGFF